MKFASILPLFLLVACTKQNADETIALQTEQNDKPVGCSFGLPQLNQAIRPTVYEVQSIALKKIRDEREEVPTAPPSSTIYIDFDGQFVSGTHWNTKGDIHAAPANLSSGEKQMILHRVKEDFAPFNVTVTTSESVYEQTNPYKRMRVVVTETYQWYGHSGGAAFMNSFQWGNNTPCFVFTTPLSYNEKWIAEAISHEVGHTLSLAHQAVFNNGSLVTEFNQGSGDGLTGWAPIMGSGYLKNLTTWHNGPSANASGQAQDEVATLRAILGSRKDEADVISKAEPLERVAIGIINTSNDVDQYYLDLKNDATISVIPSCEESCSGANVHMVLKIFKTNGTLLSTVYENDALIAQTRLNKGKYYVAVETIANGNAGRYGMLGTYAVTVKP